MHSVHLEDDPLWYKDAIIYELHIRAFRDSNGDGIGDIKGLIEKLDYLEGLGVTALWLLPFYPSPLRDDGYDIADYFSIHPDYGTMKDFRLLVREAHRRSLRVITELVLNHTSNDHSWFQRSRMAKTGSPWRDMYVWSETAEKYQDARIIFKDFETSNWRWDPAAKAYYWHRFYSHQPDLNYDCPFVHKKMLEVIDSWFSTGIDGLRLDAVPYLYERDGTNCENLPETHSFLQELRGHIDARFKNKMLLAEANQWPEDAAAYFGQGNECHMAFHFPLMPRMFMAIQMEDSFPIIDILRTTPAIPDSSQWAIFLRNHDELTLEMVTDEERDYMYRSYARDPKAKINLGIRRRLAPLLSNNRRRIELMNILLFSFPGTPVIYYGDEIGMGDNFYLGDRNGVRTPMQWSPDRNAGFSSANPQSLYFPVIIDQDYHYEAVNVENQDRNLSSLLWWMKRVIAVRKRYRAFSRGTLEIIPSNNPKVLTFIRRHEDETILVAVNLSRFIQALEIDLSAFAGSVPEEVFSGNAFPAIRETPYVLTFGPHIHYWLLLRNNAGQPGVHEAASASGIAVRGSWENVFEKKAAEVLLANVLPPYIQKCRWYAAKSKTLRRIHLVENTRIEHAGGCSRLLLFEMHFNEGVPETYFMPVSFAAEQKATELSAHLPGAVIARIKAAEGEGVLYDAIHDQDFRAALLGAIAAKRRIDGRSGSFAFYPHAKLRSLMQAADAAQTVSTALKVEQSNSSLLYGDRFFMKLYRRLGEGTNPDLEVIKHLTEKKHFPHVPSFAGAIEYRRTKTESMTVALLQSFVECSGDAWSLSIDAVTGYYDRILARKDAAGSIPADIQAMIDCGSGSIPDMMKETISMPYLEAVALLARRTAELHRALGDSAHDPDFSPEPYSMLYQRSVLQSMQSLVKKNLSLLSKRFSALPEAFQPDARMVLDSEKQIGSAFNRLLDKKIAATKIRIHGDYHLGQVLCTGRDFMIIDFEGEPSRTLSERRLKYSPFKDVAGMLRSFHYAAYGALFLSRSIRPEDRAFLEAWADPWYHCVSGLFLRSYLEAAGKIHFVPDAPQGIVILLQTYLLEKAIYELGYELNSRPDWVIIPLRGIQSIVKQHI